MEFLSHVQIENKEIIYKKLLKDHMSEVARNIREKVKEVYKDDVLAEAGYIVGISHDFGKYTKYFQNYLITGKAKSNLEWHGFISAVFAAYLIENSLKTEGKLYNYLPLLSYFAVLHHHGNLNSFDSDVLTIQKLSSKNFELADTRMREKLLLMEPQLESILNNQVVIENEYRDIFGDINLVDFKENWICILKELHRQKYNLEKKDDNLKLKVNTLLLFIYSCLIDNDKRDAAKVRKVKRKHIPEDLVDNYREEEFDVEEKQGINGIRNDIYTKVVKKISKVSLDSRIFTLTAPTGTGKTITSFSAALKLRERLKQNNIEPRIIYALPFTSIIDQNFDVIEDILGSMKDFQKNKNAYMIKHHHLADIRYRTEDETRPLDESLLLVESWDSEVIVTTFIQLFYTIIGYKNRFLKKYHNIANSIILLDEVQNIPMEYWPLASTMLKNLAKELNCYIILLTATKPLIFDENEAIELLENNQEYFEKFNRVTLKPNLQEIGVEQLAQKFCEMYEQEKSYLIVLNTIKSSLEFYEEIKDKLESLDVKTFYLSTNIIPKERKKRIDKIKDCLENDEKVVVVSTQVVEAGVDIDLDIVLRDLGPVDSIVQVAGRCNREWGSNKSGEVYVFNLRDEIHYSSRIYGSISCKASANLLKKDVLQEREFYRLITDYFDSVKVMKGIQEESDESEKILNAIYDFRFYDDLGMYDSVSDFRLIQDNNYVDVFVQADMDSIDVWERYKEKVLYEKDFKKRQENYLMIKRQFRSYIISVPGKFAKEFIRPTENSSILLLPYGNLIDYYHEDTGFNRNLENLVTMM